MRRFRRAWGVGCLLAALLTAGCGGPGYDLAPVRGQVTCRGQPVPGGTIVFSPVPLEKSTTMAAPPAMGRIDENGNFELFTDHQKGAMVGKHRVTFIVPEPDDEFDPSKADDPAEAAKEQAEREAERELALKLAKLPCLRPANPEVTVEAGENSITIELRIRDDD